MPWMGAAIGAGASILGGMMQSDAASSASRAQQAGSAAATAEQRRQYDLNRADQAPFMQTGVAANRKLAYLMGLKGSPNGGSNGLTADQLRAQLLSQYTKTGQGQGFDAWDPAKQETIHINLPGESSVDEAGLSAAIQQKLAEQDAQTAAAQNDPTYGSLTRKFSQADLEADPVYKNGLQFGLDQGTGAINARATQMGSYDSGATLKALTRYANDYGSTKANESYNRFNTDNTNLFNRLSGISGTGQTATNQVGAVGMDTANNISSNMTGAGNARAAGIVGGANAWSGVLQGGVDAYNNYQSKQMLQQLLKRNGGSNTVDYSQFAS